jgi:2-keto-3-deoxy-L-rhamnonate aldolase RhmA
MKMQINDKNKHRQLELGTWISIGDPVITELASEFKFDWLLFDLEHGCLQESSLISNFQAVRRKDIHLIVRVGSLNPALIARVLDWGATGIMIPHVSSSEQARACVNAMRYPPNGERGYSGSARKYKYGINKPDDINKISDPILIVQIENLEGVKNSEVIASIEGVDILFIGPSDLKHELSTHPEKIAIKFEDALEIVYKAAKINSKQAGILIQDTTNLEGLIQKGFSCFAISSDIKILSQGYHSIISKSNQLVQRDFS